MSFLIAQAEKPLLVWMFDVVGLNYLLFIVLSSVASFLITLTIVRKGKGALAGSALILAVLMPFFITLCFAALDGVTIFMLVARNPEWTFEPSDALFPATVFFRLVIGMFLMIPSYLLAMIAATVRSRSTKAEEAS
jgi:hypothetical protein